MRKPIIAGNWKMNNTVAAGTALVKELAPLVKDNNAEISLYAQHLLLLLLFVKL